MGERQRWLVICFAVPSDPSALRVATWRALKQLGAAPLGNGVYALPDRPELRDAFRRLVERVTNGGGTAFLLAGEGLDPADEAVLLDRLDKARADDYGQIAKSAQRFVEHVERELAADDFRFVEIESLEEELEKVRRQMQHVLARDYFDSPARGEAQSALRVAERRLAAYVEAAMEHAEP